MSTLVSPGLPVSLSPPRPDNLFDENTEGIYLDLPAARYHAAPGLSHSMMKALHPTPAHLVDYLAEPREPSPEQILGTLTHALVLEPDKPLPVIIVPPATYPAPADCSAVKQKKCQPGDPLEWHWSAGYCKAWQQNQLAAGRIILSQREYDAAYGMARSIAAHPLCKLIFRKGQGRSELSLFRRYHYGGSCLLKARIDFVPDGNSLVDVKTTMDASEPSFSKTILDYRYHSQAAHYLDTYNEAMGHAEKDCYILIAVEKKPPYHVATYTLEAESISLGRLQNAADTATYMECTREKKWPAYPVCFVPIGIPQWAKTKALA